MFIIESIESMKLSIFEALGSDLKICLWELTPWNCLYEGWWNLLHLLMSSVKLALNYTGPLCGICRILSLRRPNQQKFLEIKDKCQRMVNYWMAWTPEASVSPLLCSISPQLLVLEAECNVSNVHSGQQTPGSKHLQSHAFTITHKERYMEIGQ